MEHTPEAEDDIQEHHRQQLQVIVDRGDIKTLLACLVHDVNAHHACVLGYLSVFGFENPALVDHPSIHSVRASTNELRALVRLYRDLLLPLVSSAPPPGT